MDSTFKSLQCRFHPEEQVMGVCLVEKCEFASRLVCFSCTLEDHSDHARNIVKLRDLDSKSPLQHHNWPQNEMAQDIKKYLQQVSYLMQGGEQAIDKLFEEITQTVLTELQKAKKAVKTSMERYLASSTDHSSDELTEKLRSQLLQIFDISKLGTLFNSLRNSEISEADFNSDVSDFTKTVNSEELLTPLQNLLESENKNIKKILDTDIVRDRVKDITQLVREIPEEIVTESVIGCPFKFVAEEKNAKTVIIGKSGRYCKMPSSYQGVYGSICFERGRWEFEIETISNMQSNCVLFGLIPEDQKNNSQNSYSSHIYHCFGNSCSGNCTTQGSTIESEYQQGNILKVFIDMDNNKYEFGWKTGQSKHINSGYTLQGKKMRFFINSYGMGNLEFQVLKAKRSMATTLVKGKESEVDQDKKDSTAPTEQIVPDDSESGGLFG